MSGEDKDQKTEQPTQKKLDDARKKGQVALSRELNHWFMMIGATALVMSLAPAMFSRLAKMMTVFIGSAHALPTGQGGIGTVLTGALGETVMTLLVPIGALLAAAVASTMLQTRGVLSFQSLKPKFEKIMPQSGLKRLFGPKALVEFAKTLFVVIALCIVMTMLLKPAFGSIDRYIGLDMLFVLSGTQSLTLKLLSAVLAVITLTAVLDYGWQKFQFIKNLRMTKQEIKEEYKQTEGDPHIKGRLRQLRMEKARKRMMAQVPKADVVITNPTHYAVALKYDPKTMNAPVVLAKGADAIAFKIREVAKQHEIPVLENPPLARGLYATAELDEEIPVEHFKAVAEVISYVFKLKAGMPRR